MRRYGHRSRQRVIQFEPRVRDVVKPPFGIFLQTAPQQSTDIDWSVLRQRIPARLNSKHRSNRVRSRPSCKCAAPGKHFIQYAPKRPNVRPFVESLSTSLFRTHVRRSSENSAFSGYCGRLRQVGSFSGESFREPEIEDLYISIGCDLDVRRLQISVNDTLVVGCFYSLTNLMRDFHRTVQRHGTTLKTICQRRPVDQLEHKGTSITRFFQAINCADVRMIKRRKSARFLLETAAPGRIVCERGTQYFDGHIASQPCVSSAIHFAHTALAKQRQNFIRPDFPANP